MTGKKQEDLSKNCSHEWMTYLATDDIVWFCCKKCKEDRFVSARYIDKLFTYDGMSLDELESYQFDEGTLTPEEVQKIFPWKEE